MYYSEDGRIVEDLSELPIGSFYKNKKTDKIWWKVADPKIISDGTDFSFDRERIYNTYDYCKLSKEEREIFDLENPWYAVRFNGAKNVSEKVREAYKKEMGHYPYE